MRVGFGLTSDKDAIPFLERSPTTQLCAAAGLSNKRCQRSIISINVRLPRTTEKLAKGVVGGGRLGGVMLGVNTQRQASARADMWY